MLTSALFIGTSLENIEVYMQYNSDIPGNTQQVPLVAGSESDVLPAKGLNGIPKTKRNLVSKQAWDSSLIRPIESLVSQSGQSKTNGAG